MKNFKKVAKKEKSAKFFGGLSKFFGFGEFLILGAIGVGIKLPFSLTMIAEFPSIIFTCVKLLLLPPLLIGLAVGVGVAIICKLISKAVNKSLDKRKLELRELTNKTNFTTSKEAKAAKEQQRQAEVDEYAKKLAQKWGVTSEQESPNNSEQK